MFGSTPRTAFDVEFSLFGIPVRVHPFFWIFATLLGWAFMPANLIVIWVVCMFLSVLIHEMGHALTSRYFGYWPHIVLHHFGGYANFNPTKNYTLRKSIAITFAGPLAGFLFFGLLVVIQQLLINYNVEVSQPIWDTIGILQIMNLYWGIFNLLPVLPLDGGQICRDFLLMIRRIDGELWALRISIVVGLAVTILLLKWGATYGAVLFGLMTFSNFQMLGERNRR